MDVRLVIDPDLCIGYGECVGEDPEAVRLDDDGCARPIVASLSRDRAERLCAVCPTGAISTVADAAA
jgi:ferredoxin